MLIAYLCFFQAEDGIRDIGVTGIQTCALPISKTFAPSWCMMEMACSPATATPKTMTFAAFVVPAAVVSIGTYLPNVLAPMRSEERRVGKECRSRWSPYH